MESMIIDDWYDWWRLFVIGMAVVCLVLLGRQFYTCHEHWGEKHRDRWYLACVWTVAAIEIKLEGILRDTDLRFRTIFVTVGVIVTLRLLTKPYEDHPSND